MAEVEEAGATAKAKAKNRLLSAVAVALVVYLGSTVGFSYLLGAFDPQPPPEVVGETKPEMGVAKEAPGHNEPATFAEAALEPDSHPEESNGEVPSAAMDSLEAVQWFERERKDIKQQRNGLESQKRELALLKRDIEKLLSGVQEAKSERIVKMAKLYNSMDPEAVAKQLGNMDDRMVMMLLPQMNTRTGAKVMALLDPQRAAQIATKLLALDQS